MKCNFYVKIDDKILKLSLEELVSFLLANGITSDNNIVHLENKIKYSLSEADIIAQRLKSDTKQHKETIASYIDGDPEFEDVITPQELVDSDVFHQIGFPRLPLKNDENFIENMTRILLDENVENAELKVREIVLHWDVIADDARLLHRFLPLALANLKNESEFRKLLKSEDFYPLYKKLLGTVELPNGKVVTKIDMFMENLRNVENTTIKYILGGLDLGQSASAINISLDVEIPMIELIMSCHADKIYIDLNGELYVINYKFSASPYKEWSSVKKEKYKYKMALVKRALEAKGYNVQGIKMYDIPMYIEYDGDDIKSIRRDPTLESINYIIENNKAALLQYENFVKQFIDIPITVTLPTTERDLELANNVLQTILPKTGVRAEGIQMTAELWIKEYTGISIVSNSDLRSDVTYYVDLLDGNPPIPITERNVPEKNQQILDLVKSHTELFEKGSEVVMNHLIKAIRNNYKYKTCLFENGSGFKFNSSYLETSLKAYFELDDDENPLWEMIETPELHNCGLILFKHKKTDQLDLVIASPHNVNIQMKLNDGNVNLLGMHLYDMNAGHMLKGDYGNMEIIKGLTVLNQILPKIKGEYKFGNIKVITPNVGGSGRIRTFQQMLPYFGKILLFANSRLNDKVLNNFYKKEIVNPIDTILYEYGKILLLDNVSDVEKLKIGDLGFKELVNVKSTSEKINALRNLAECVLEKMGNPTIEEIRNNKQNSAYEETRILANIYIECINHINYLYGNYEFSVENINTFQRYVLPQYANPDPNVRMVTDIYSSALDDTAIEFGKKYKPIRKVVEKFLEDMGYGDALKTLLGNSVRIYDNLFERDEKGNKTLRFKNPYSDPTLSPTESEFLKFVLFLFAKLRAERGGYADFNISNYNDPKIKDFIEAHKIDYFYVPLKRKSSKSANSTPIETVQYKIGKFKQRIKGLRDNTLDYIKSWILEVQDKFEYSSDENKKAPVESMKVKNPYIMSENATLRATMINRFGADYFETDVELLLADYVEKHIVTNKMQEVLFRVRSILTQLHILGSIEGNEKEFQASIKEIEDFIRLNMFGQSIMEDFSNKAMLMLLPLKSMVSKVYIAANIRSAFRDTFEGVWLNIARTINHYQTDIDSKSLLNGYKLVVSEAIQSSKGIGIMSELCLRYRLSNTDEARIAEKATNRGGIFDVDSWTYSTLRGPDFLNRMVLFTARCVKDGVWLAFSLDENGDLKYDWRKDGRFILYALGNKEHPDYIKQKGLYLSKIRLYNLDHPSANLSYNDDLPEPYSQKEVKAIRLLSNSIYGAYDKSQRAKLENIAIGQTFCMFSTWLNGITANYLRKPGEYSEYTELKHRLDEDGNYLYFDDKYNILTKIGDKYYNEVNEEVQVNEPSPVYEQVPVMVQGILYTLGRSVKMLISDNGVAKFRELILGNEYEKRNILKALSDLAMWMFLGLLFGVVLKEGYEEFKKDKNANDVLTNAAVELLYSSAARSYDGFKGIFALTDFVLNDAEPLAINANVSLVKDLGKTMFGPMQWKTLLYKDVPVFRAFRQTYNKALKLDE